MTMTKEDRHYTRTTSQETKWLDDLRVRHNFVSRSETIRYCIQHTIEDESDAIGSRRHFSRTMNHKIDALMEEIRLANAVQLLAVTDGLTNLTNLLEEDENASPLVADEVRIELYKTAVTSDLLKIVAAHEAIYKQQRKELRKKNPAKKQKPESSDL
jgi:Arc/MetJ-type ribon-helix-helix transcriptional regulator